MVIGSVFVVWNLYECIFYRFWGRLNGANSVWFLTYLDGVIRFGVFPELAHLGPKTDDDAKSPAILLCCKCLF